MFQEPYHHRAFALCRRNRKDSLEGCAVIDTPKDSESPRLLTKKDAAAYVGVSVATFAKWVAAGLFPPSLSITKMWDRKAIDAQLDKMSGLEVKPLTMAGMNAEGWSVMRKKLPDLAYSDRRQMAQTSCRELINLAFAHFGRVSAIQQVKSDIYCSDVP